MTNYLKAAAISAGILAVLAVACLPGFEVLAYTIIAASISAGVFFLVLSVIND